MKKSALCLLLCAIVVCGCAHQYTMKLSNGGQIVTPHKPKLKGGLYYYKDAKGGQHAVSQSRVLEIEPSSFVGEEDKATQQPKPKRHWWQFWRD